MTSLNSYIEAQKSALKIQFTKHMTFCLAATTHARIQEHAEHYGWKIEPIPGIKASSALVIKKRDGAFPEIWARHDYHGYRKAFQNYLRTFFQISDKLPTTFQVDHMHPTLLFKEDRQNYFIRLFLISQDVNSSFGAGFEKTFYNMESERNNINGGYHMDWITLLKAFEIKLPSKTLSEKRWKSWAVETAKHLEQEKVDSYREAYRGVLDMLRLGYTGFYKGRPGQNILYSGEYSD
jgi:hypothetical protein